MTPGTTQLSISARYVPPLGALGSAIDRALLHRVAEATMKDFLDRVATALLDGAQPGRPRRTASMGPMAEPPLRVMLVDDHEVVRGGVRAMLQATEDIIVTAEAASVREAIDEAARSRPDVIVMDVRLTDGSGIEATRQIRADRPATKVLMLTSFADDEALFASIMAGASGYVLKQVNSAELLRAIRARGPGREPAGSRGHDLGAGSAAQGQAPHAGRAARAPVTAGGTDPQLGGGRARPTGRSARSSAWRRRR